MANAGAGSHFLLFPTSVTPSACPAASLSRNEHGRRRRSAMLCRAGGLDRRDVLAGLSLTGVAAGGLNLAAESSGTDVCLRGDKIMDLRLSCHPSGSSPCPSPPPSPFSIVNFKPPTGPVRVRQPAHLADAGLVDKYKLALARMRALPDSDPRSFASQAAIHQAYCDGHYQYQMPVRPLPGGGMPPMPMPPPSAFDVHFSWIFAPWHRMYIYFYERILGSLIGDDAFALPYWNWDAPSGMVLPEMFKDPASPLYDANRDPTHVDAYVVLDYNKGGDVIPFDPVAVQQHRYNKVVKDNLATLYNQAEGARCFLGERFCTSLKVNQKSGTAGTLESKAHTGVHIWLGDSSKCTTGYDGVQYCDNDMGFLGTAGRDPAFYSHHANVDRMWHIWADELGHRGFEDPEWLDTSFVFYDETPRPVRVRVRDVLDVAALGYRYEEREPLQWLDCRPTSRRAPKDTTTGTGGGAARAARTPAPVFPLRLRVGRNVVVPSVRRPTRNATKKGELQVLVFDAVEFDPCRDAKFDVVINVAPEVAGGVTPQWVEYAGSFVSIQRGGAKPGETIVVMVQLPVEDVFDDIGVVGDVDAVNVVLVPRTEGITILSPPTIVSQEC
ncbi:hypothetical protein QOZ80_8BG0647800 [Eleusine coracana subsp. coracana]|nr:hypothetical protein QOZ80_8BG0647800 [Eleusine coracana subsp. coracana]